MPQKSGMKLFDAHGHLPNTEAELPDLPRVVCGTCEADWDAVLAHGSSDHRVIAMLGLHPWFVEAASPEWAPRLESSLRTNRAGVGECGLDFARRETDKGLQEAAFRAQLRLAHVLNRPIALHVVRAWGRVVQLLKEDGVPPAGAMVHAFSGSPETARTLQSMGVFLSFSGDLMDPGRPRLGESLKAVSADRLLLETDGTTDLAQLHQRAAELRRMEVEVLAAQTWDNGQRCFRELLA